MKKKLYSVLASLIQARNRCIEANNQEWLENHTETILKLCKNEMPSGSGIDRGTKINLDESGPDRLVFYFGFHYMNENGFYDGWTEHRLIVKPDLANGINLKIIGPDRNQIKEYLYEVYRTDLEREVDY